jgi:glycosyltransferase involved in cell wall biosynthesis
LPHLYSTANMGSSFVINIEELWANSANKFFDTLAASKPVLINYGGWQKETIETNDIGYVLPPHLDRDAARAFIEYTRQEEQVRQQCKNALSLAKESYSLNVAASRYMDILTSTTGLNT